MTLFAEMRSELNGKPKGAYDTFWYENAYRDRRCRIRLSGGDDSVDTETRDNMDVLRITWKIVPSVSLAHG